MPAFVPVEDAETPRSERDASDPNLRKHRQWDGHVIARSAAELRGEQQPPPPSSSFLLPFAGGWLLVCV